MHPSAGRRPDLGSRPPLVLAGFIALRRASRPAATPPDQQAVAVNDLIPGVVADELRGVPTGRAARRTRPFSPVVVYSGAEPFVCWHTGTLLPVGHIGTGSATVVDRTVHLVRGSACAMGTVVGVTFTDVR